MMNQYIKGFGVTDNLNLPKDDHFIHLAKELTQDSRVKILSGPKSQKGKDLLAFAIGTGSKVIGVTSGAHSDEPEDRTFKSRIPQPKHLVFASYLLKFCC